MGVTRALFPTSRLVPFARKMRTDKQEPQHIAIVKL